ncbi:MAG: SGNH/GDSL hydrolase family protein [Bacteroidaceae bacterium]|nr:SGNH/GDSL hydrolase family protein [Bacteroidaceae bacterium]
MAAKNKIAVAFALLLLAAAAYIVISRRTSKAEIQTYFVVPHPQRNDSLSMVAIIGDSWAFRAKDVIPGAFPHLSFLICGQPGAKSRDIYLNLFSDKEPWGTKSIIARRPSYCIVFAGINDVHGQYGADYYSHHMLLIIEALLHYNITPVIIDIPHFYNDVQYTKYPLYKQFAYKVLQLIHGEALVEDQIQVYHNALKNELKKHNKEHSIILIEADNVLKNNLDLFDDNMHLNDKGYILLFTSILDNIRINR